MTLVTDPNLPSFTFYFVLYAIEITTAATGRHEPRNKAAAVKLLRKLMKKLGFAPRLLVNKLPSYGAQRFLSSHVAVYNTFNVQRHLISRRTLRGFRASAIEEWRSAAAT